MLTLRKTDPSFVEGERKQLKSLPSEVNADGEKPVKSTGDNSSVVKKGKFGTHMALDIKLQTLLQENK